MAVIGIIGLKGGAGRSTVATSLAVAIPGSAIVDADPPQGTATSWGMIRGRSEPPPVFTAESLAGLTGLVAEASRQHPIVIVDTPPRIAEATRAAVVLSDLVLVPVAPSVAELWAVSDLVPILKAAKRLDRSWLLWNRVRAYTKSAGEIQAVAKAELPIPALKSQLGMRVAYSDAMAAGMGVTEFGEPVAREEMQNLAREVSRLLKGRK